MSKEEAKKKKQDPEVVRERTEHVKEQLGFWESALQKDDDNKHLSAILTDAKEQIKKDVWWQIMEVQADPDTEAVNTSFQSVVTENRALASIAAIRYMVDEWYARDEDNGQIVRLEELTKEYLKKPPKLESLVELCDKLGTYLEDESECNGPCWRVQEVHSVTQGASTTAEQVAYLTSRDCHLGGYSYLQSRDEHRRDSDSE